MTDAAHNLETLTCACGQPSELECGACRDCYRGKRYPTDERGSTDAGSARESRERPCPNTWCVRSEHEGNGSCVIAPRRAMPASDFGPERAKGRRW